MQNTISKPEMQQIAVEVGIFEITRPMRTDDRLDEANVEDLAENPYTTGIDDLRRTFIENTKEFVFRTIDTVTVADEDRIGCGYLAPTPTGEVSAVFYKSGEPHPIFTPYELERNVEVHAKKFFCLTKRAPLRPGTKGESKVAGGQILLLSEKYGCLDLFDNMDFKMVHSQNLIVPVAGDMVCILPAKGRKGQEPEAEAWFVCSPQFLRTWTLIHYNEHDSIKALAPHRDPSVDRHDEAVLRKKVFSGNTTMTNAYLSWVISCYQNGLVSDEAELRNRFWNVRTEYASREFIHVYSALVLMLRYSECPGPYNIPNKLDSSPKLRTWHLPQGWLERLFQKYELRLLPDTAIRFMDVPVPSSEVPKGTRLMSAAVFPADEVHVEKPEAAVQSPRWGDCVVDE